MKDGTVKKPLRNGKFLKFPDNQLQEDEKRELARGAIWNGPIEKEEYAPPPWLFQHQDLNGTLESAKLVDERFLKNKLNTDFRVAMRLIENALKSRKFPVKS